MPNCRFNKLKLPTVMVLSFACFISLLCAYSGEACRFCNSTVWSVVDVSNCERRVISDIASTVS